MKFKISWLSTLMASAIAGLVIFSSSGFPFRHRVQAQEPHIHQEFPRLIPVEGTTRETSLIAQGGQPSYLSKMMEWVDQDSDRLTDIFKDIHQHPELGFMETRTASIVAENLQALGYEVKTGIGETGVVGILRNGEGPTVMFRADMDANAVEEDTGLPYSSTVRVLNLEGEEVPVMHACGHDAHTTWMLGLAKGFCRKKYESPGRLV